MFPTKYDGKPCPWAPVRSRRNASFHGQPPAPLNLYVLECPCAPKKPEGFLTLLEGVQGKELFPVECPGAPKKPEDSLRLHEDVQGKELFPAECPWAPKKPEGSLRLPNNCQGRKLNF